MTLIPRVRILRPRSEVIHPKGRRKDRRGGHPFGMGSRA
jgi:hypothetical protein